MKSIAFVKKSIKTALCGALAILLAVSSADVFGAEEVVGAPNYGDFTVNDYAEYISEYKEQEHPNNTVEVDITSYTQQYSGGFVTEIDGKTAVGLSDTNREVTYSISIPQSGMYCVRIDYSLSEGSMSDAEIAFRINGEPPFDSAERIKLRGYYVDNGTFEYDAAGNQIRPMQISKSVEQSLFLQESDGLYDTPYEFYFKEGENTVCIATNKGDIALSGLSVCPKPQEKASYSEVSAKYGKQELSGEYIEIPAEKPTAKSDATLYAVYDRSNAATSPSDPALICYNTIGQANWQYDGQWIEWEFEVEKTGYYEIGMRVRQDILSGFSTNRRIYIDGEVPFKELLCVGFEYGRSWRVETFGGEKPYLFYLEKGSHTIRMEVVTGEIAEIMRALEQEVYKLQYLYRNMIMVTGTNPDPYRDYYLEQDIDGLLQSFEDIAKALHTQKEKLDGLMGQKGSEGIVIEQMATFLETLLKKPASIAKRLSTYNSYVTSLSGWIGSGRVQPLEIDCIFVKTSDMKAPNATAGFFEQLLFKIEGIIRSYITDYNTIGGVNEYPESIDVWTSTGREQATAIKDMITRTFSKEKKIGVNVKLVTGGILEAILTGRGPDVALFVGGDMPVNLSARDAVADLSEMPDFDEVSKRFYSEALVPFGYRGGTYALPLTQTFPMLFLRTDVLHDLGIDTNIETWDQFYEILPILMRNNLQVGLGDTMQSIKATGSGNNYGFSLFTTLLLQQGGNFYNSSLTKTTFSDEQSIEIFTTWTDLYTKYSFDITYNFLTRFRTGEMPVVINAYSAYNTLQIAAPEIRGLWKMVPIPGTRDESGNINRAVNSSMTAAIVLKGDNEKSGWEFVKWFTSDEVQTEYAYMTEALLGASGRYTPANIKVLSTLPWSRAELEDIEEQWQYVTEVPVIPSAYAVTRGLTNAFRKVVNNLENPRKTILNYDITMNKEIRSKWKEFGIEVTDEDE